MGPFWLALSSELNFSVGEIHSNSLMLTKIDEGMYNGDLDSVQGLIPSSLWLQRDSKLMMGGRS